MAVLAFGIAANTAVFTIANAIVIRDLPFDQPDRLVEIRTRTREGDWSMSYPDLRDVLQRTRTFEGTAGFADDTMNVSEETRAAERFVGAYVSANAFALVGQQPILGRAFTTDDERPGAQPVVMLGYAVWQSRYQSDKGVLGRTVRVNGVPSVVIGVMAEGFGFPLVSEMWQPLTLLPPQRLERRDERTLGTVGRLRPGATLEQARADLDIIMAALAREYPDTNADVRPIVNTFRYGIGPQVSTTIYALLGAVTFVLLIVCANVANLLLARATDRTREISARIAIGASRWQITRQLLIESVLLALTGGLIGLGLSVIGVRIFARAVADSGAPYWLDFAFDIRVFGFFAAVCLGTALLFGLAPALYASRMNVSESLNEAGRSGAGTIRIRRWAGALVILQLALAPILLTSAGLMMRTLLAEYSINSGIETDGLFRLRLSLTSQGYPNPDQRARFYRQLEDRLASGPNFRAALAHAAPLEGATPRTVSFDSGRDDRPGAGPVASIVTIGLRYFDTLGVALLRGRDFRESDTGVGDVPAIVNARFAELHFPDRDPIGQRIRLTANGLRDDTEPERVTVVGVVANVRQREIDPLAFDPIVYLPYAANPLTWASILVRTESDVALVASQVRERVRALDPDLPLFDILTIDAVLDRELWATQIFGAMFTIFALIALATSAVGLYAVTARAAAQRTREIGIRMALGAQARQIWWLVTRRVSIQLAIGAVLGIAGAVAFARLLQGVLFRVSPADPPTLLGVSILLVVVGVGASLTPARRAMRLDPVAALRHE